MYVLDPNGPTQSCWRQGLAEEKSFMRLKTYSRNDFLKRNSCLDVISQEKKTHIFLFCENMMA